MRILLGAAVLFAGSVALAQNPAPAFQKVLTNATCASAHRIFTLRPSSLPAGKTELIASKPFYEIPFVLRISAVRILYHSRSRADKTWPYRVWSYFRRNPSLRWLAVIAWAHEFTGSARQCAPSLISNLNDGPLLSMYVGLGYAVVASDYGGLGIISRMRVGYAPNALDGSTPSRQPRRAVATRNQMAGSRIRSGRSRGRRRRRSSQRTR